MNFTIKKIKGKYYFEGTDGIIYGEGYDIAGSSHLGEHCRWVEKDGKRYYVILEEFTKKGLSHLYLYPGFNEGYSVVYENGKYYVINENFEICSRGYDNAEMFDSGFAIVTKGGKSYFIGTDMERHGDKYDELEFVDDEGYYAIGKKGEKYYKIDVDLDRDRLTKKELDYFGVRKLTTADYLKEAKTNPNSISDIPTREFSDKFVKKLKKNLLKYFKNKIAKDEDFNEEELNEDLAKIQSVIQSKQEKYQIIYGKKKEKFIKKAEIILAGKIPKNSEALSEESKVQTKPEVEKPKNKGIAIDEPKVTKPEPEQAKPKVKGPTQAEKPVEQVKPSEQNEAVFKKSDETNTAIREISERLQKYYQILLYKSRKPSEGEKNAIKNYITKNSEVIASDEILSQLCNKILLLCESAKTGEENE